MESKIAAIIERETGQKVTAETRLDAIDCDSLEYLELILTIERELGIPQEAAQAAVTVGDLAK